MCILTELGMIVKPFLKFSWRVERNILLRTGNFAYFACFCRGIVDNFLFPVDTVSYTHLTLPTIA